MLKNTTTQFDFSAQPKVTALKPKYREQREIQRWQGTSLMNDPRIIRGNTYAAIVQNKNQIQPPPVKKKTLKQIPKKRQKRINFDTGFQPSTPRAVDGRQHFSIQTDPFVQTLRDKPVNYEKQCQTDLFLDRPVQRQFDPMKQKTGINQTTQIQQNDAQLFNFDYQVQPILDALLSKVVQTSRMQLYQQKQLQQKQRQKNQYEKRRHAKLSQAQKLQSKQIRIKQQTQRRNLQFKKSNEQQAFAQKKLISRILSKQYLKNLKQNTNMILQQQGFFRQPLQTDLYQVYTPWLYEQIISQLQADQQYKQQVTNLTKQLQKQLQSDTAASILKQKQRRQKIIDQKQLAKRFKIQAKLQKLKQKQQEQARNKAEQQALNNQTNPVEGINPNP